MDQASARIAVLILKPDPWRFRGMSAVLDEAGGIDVVGERDFVRVLTADVIATDLHPHVVLVAHRFIVEYGLPLVARIRELFRGAPLIVHGDEESVPASADIFAAGASGYFNMMSASGGLPRAVCIVARGKMWGPREAVALMAQRIVERNDPIRKTDMIEDDLLLLRHLHEGLSNKEIANRLNIAEVTVKTRLGRLYKKFGVSTRLQLLTTAIREGMVV